MSKNKYLPPGFVLTGGRYRYRIERVLGGGGFGITYLASTTVRVGTVNIEAQFALKEHFLDADCERENGSYSVSYSNPAADRVEGARKDFYSEAVRLQKLSGKHPNLVKVNEVFEANNTVYYVMEYLNGESLRSFVKKRGRLSETQTKELMEPIVDVVSFIHSQRITHLDIKPDNIMIVLDDDGRLKPVLIDFGLAKHYDTAGNPTSTINLTAYSAGYAPIEQYAGISTFSPESDIYSLGATISYCLTGNRPPEALHLRDGELAAGLPSDVSNEMRDIIYLATRRFERVMPVFTLNGRKPYSSAETSWDDETTRVNKQFSKAQSSGSIHSNEDTYVNGNAYADNQSEIHPEINSSVTADRNGSIDNSALVKRNLKVAAICLSLGILFFVLKPYIFSTDANSARDAGESVGEVSDEELAIVEELPFTTYEANGVEFEMISIEGGSYQMGSNDSDAKEWEKPAHSVTVSSFEIGATEVTQALWVAVMGSNPAYSAGENLPVENVSWEDCQEFIKRLNRITGQNFRLPTEEEWEFAARGGKESEGFKYSGSNNVDEVAWYDGTDGVKTTHAVGLGVAHNELFIWDMSGNVWEWTQNNWTPSYSQSPTSERVCRGGGYSSDASMCTVTYRRNRTPDYRDRNLGLRLAL